MTRGFLYGFFCIKQHFKMFFNLIFMVYILFSFPIAISFKMAGTYLVPYRIASWAEVMLLWCAAALTSLMLSVNPD